MKIMFICTGNICRSAMAEGLMKKMLNDRGRNDVEVYSAGLQAITGEYASDEAITVMKDYGVDILKHRSTYVKESNIEEMDLILCATYSHRITLEYMYPKLVNKIYTMKECAYGTDTMDKDIKDPWGYTIDVYEKCAGEIKETLDKIIEKI